MLLKEADPMLVDGVVMTNEQHEPGDGQHVHQPNEHTVSIEREKTKRTYAWLGLLAILATLTIALFFQSVEKGTLTVNAGGIEVTVDKPLIDQVKHDEQFIKGASDSVRVTTGSVSDTLVQRIEQAFEGDVLPTDKFVGKNLIDRKGGFVVSASNPDAWNVQHNMVGYNQRFDPIVTMKSDQGAAVTVNRHNRDGASCFDIQCFVTKTVEREKESNAIVGRPSVSIDSTKNIALIEYTTNQKQNVTMKVVLENNAWYVARTVVEASATAELRKDAVEMVTTFSAIQKKPKLELNTTRTPIRR